MDIIRALGMIMAFYPGVLPSLVFLAAASYYDVKYRELDSKFLAAFAPVAVVVVALSLLTQRAELFVVAVDMAVTVVLAGSSAAMYKMGFKGPADAFLLLILGAMNPYLLNIYGVPVLPVLSSVLLGLAYVVAVVAWNVAWNIVRLRDFAEATRGLGLADKLYYMMVGKVMSTDEFRRKRFYFPLVADGFKRRVADVATEPLEGSGYSISGKYVVATYGFPFAAVLLVGYVLTILLAAHSLTRFRLC